MSDPGTTYRTREEIQEVRSSRDPIAGLKRYILDWGVDEEANLKAIDKAAKEEVENAVAEAKDSPYPDLKEFWTDIYVGRAPKHATRTGHSEPAAICVICQESVADNGV